MPRKNPKPLTSVQQELAMSCHALAHLEALRYHKKYPQIALEECTSQAMESLIYAARAFKPELGYRFTTYAVNAIRNRYIWYWKQQQAQKHRCPGRLYLASELESKRQSDSELEWWSGSYLDPEIDDRLEMVKKICFPQDWELLYKRHILGMHYKEIALELGLSSQRVQQKLTKAMARIRKRLPGNVFYPAGRS